MPYETVHEKVVQEKRIRVCARCRTQIADSTNRRTYNQVGGIGGSLTASLGGSMLLGSVLGPVGAIGGAIAGSFAGAKAGRNASDKLCETVESQQDDLCPACRRSSSGGGGAQMLGGSGQRSGQQPDNTANSNPTTERIGEAASAAGRGISNGFNWMKQSVTNVVDNAKKPDSNNNNNPPTGGEGNQTSGWL